MKKKILFLIFILLMLILGLMAFYKGHIKDGFTGKEHIISITSDNKKIEAVTGSFCYRDGVCIDKINFEDFNYDIINTYYGNKLNLHNVGGAVKSIEVFNYSTREFTDTKVEFTNEYIITPNITGVYIFRINAIYQGKQIRYHFMTKINKTSGEEVNIELLVKDNTLTNKGLTMIIKNLTKKDISYGNPFTIEKYDNGYWVTLKPINEVAFTLPLYNLKKNDSKEITINWEYGYGLLKGKYRIVKEFGYQDNYFNKYLEFEIE